MWSDNLKETFSKPIQKRLLRVEIAPSTMVLVVLVAVGAWMLIRLLPVLLVMAAALMIVGTLSPSLKWLEERGIQRGAGIAIIFSLLLIIIILLVTLTIPVLVAQVTSLI